MARDWTELYREYQGMWVALKDDHVTPVAGGRTRREARKAGVRPALRRQDARRPEGLRGLTSVRFDYTRFDSSRLRPLVDEGDLSVEPACPRGSRRRRAAEWP